MDLVTPILMLLAGFIVSSQSFPDEAKSLPDPSVFEMKTPPGFMRFFPLKDEESDEKPKNWSWSSLASNKNGVNIKFPDWFYLSTMKPETVPQLDKKTEKEDSVEEKPHINNNMNWNQHMQSAFSFIDSPKEDQKSDVYPSYYNFGYNTYPSWMTMSGLQNILNGKQKESDDIEIKEKNANKVAELQDKVADSSKVNEKEEIIKNEDAIAVLSSDLSSEKINLEPDQKPPSVTPEEDEGAKITTIASTNVANDASNSIIKSIDEEPNIPAKLDIEPVIQQEPQITGNMVLIPMAIMPNNQAVNTQNSKPMLNLQKPNQVQGIILPNPDSQVVINPHNLEEEDTVVSNSGNLESKTPETNQKQNLMPNNYLYNLLQKVNLSDLIFSSTNSDSKDSNPSSTQIAAMLMTAKDPPKHQGRSIVSGNNVVINNADKLPNVDQNIKPAPVPNTPNNLPLPNVSQNQGNMPNIQPTQQARPQMLNTMPNTNTGNLPVNLPSNYGNPYVNQNNNYPYNQAQPMFVNLPYTNTNSVPVNYVIANTGAQIPLNLQGNVINGQTLQPGPGNNNMALISPGMNTGQNIYAIVPLANSGDVGNVNAIPNAYINNPQVSPSYQIVNPLPVYNLVPVNANMLLNTKDDADE